MHLIALHDTVGSSNPLGISGNYDRLPFAPYFIFKDLITIFIFFFVLSIFVFFMPNALGDSENYVMANPMQTPPAIVPEWYLLPFYAILRSIPNKLLGVIAMFSAILILLIMPITDLSKYRGIQFRPFSKIAFYIFVANFLILMQLGAKHVESPFIEFGQISTILYFSHFLIIIPVVSFIENSLIELAIDGSAGGNLEGFEKFKNRNLLLAMPHAILPAALSGRPQYRQLEGLRLRISEFDGKARSRFDEVADFARSSNVSIYKGVPRDVPGYETIPFRVNTNQGILDYYMARGNTDVYSNGHSEGTMGSLLQRFYTHAHNSLVEGINASNQAKVLIHQGIELETSLSDMSPLYLAHYEGEALSDILEALSELFMAVS
jgi:ubiquinol-cytochrome c reductase cytochrome b subunit